MRLGFISFTGLVFNTDTPYKKPLGGSESAMCYLAVELAKIGHQVVLFTRLKRKTTTRGVICLPADRASEQVLKRLDILVVQNSPLQGFQIKSLLGENTKLVLWTQHAHDQPAVQSMLEREICASYDGIAVISKWQMDRYRETFPIPVSKMTILRNAISPTFEDLFFSERQLDKAKTYPPVLAYTSTPFRGLNLLVQLFPAIRELVPGTRLKIFSSMKLYQTSEEDEKKNFGELYRLCRETDGVEYIGSVSQTRLASQMRSISCLAYPNTFPETSCIAAMEAMAAGCQVITSELGALPETTAGFGKLIPVTGDWNEYCRLFIKEAVTFLRDFMGKGRRKMLDKLFKQVQYINKNNTWKVRAKEWEKWLKTLISTTK